VIPIFTRARFKPMVRAICPPIAACPPEDIFDARRNIGLQFMEPGKQGFDQVQFLEPLAKQPSRLGIRDTPFELQC
jgi:hypothetical protein